MLCKTLKTSEKCIFNEFKISINIFINGNSEELCALAKISKLKTFKFLFKNKEL